MFREGRAGLHAYLREADALPLRDYVPLVEDTVVSDRERGCCRGYFTRSEPDDDINYTVLALLLLDELGGDLDGLAQHAAGHPSLPGGANAGRFGGYGSHGPGSSGVRASIGRSIIGRSDNAVIKDSRST